LIWESSGKRSHNFILTLGVSNQEESRVQVPRHGAAVIVIFIVIMLAYAAIQPDRFEVHRSTGIKASNDVIVPFDKRDPNIKGAYAGPRER
jgi:hypothetical protein